MIHPRDVAEVLRVIRKVDTASGPGVLNTRDQLIIGGPDLPREPRARRPTGLFPVKIVQVGGSNGDKFGPATWTYDIYSLTGNPSDSPDQGMLLAEAQDIAPQRPNGTRSPGDFYGIAFYDGDTLILWDVGEYPGTGACP